MTRAREANESLASLFMKYQELPNGGPALSVLPNGAITDGLFIVAKFGSKSSACRQLRKACFLPTLLGWFTYQKANQINSNR